MSEALDYLIVKAEAGVRHERTIATLAELHQPVERTEPTRQACGSCVAGYDPRTGELVNAAWPCQTAAILAAAGQWTTTEQVVTLGANDGLKIRRVQP